MLIAPGGSPIHVAVNCQLWPVFNVVALRISTGTLAARRQLSNFGEKSARASGGMDDEFIHVVNLSSGSPAKQVPFHQVRQALGARVVWPDQSGQIDKWVGQQTGAQVLLNSFQEFALDLGNDGDVVLLGNLRIRLDSSRFFNSR